MKVTSHIGPMLFASAVIAQTAVQCPPNETDNPADQPGNPGYVGTDFSFNGTGKIHMHPGCTYFRQNYPRNITRESVGCLNDDGHLVPIEGDNCATFHYVTGTTQAVNYETEVFQNVKNGYVCGWDDSLKWLCASDKNGSFSGELLIPPKPTKVNPYYYFGSFVPGELSTTLWTFWIKHPPTSADDAQSLEYRIPDNSIANQTFQPGDGTYPVIMELVIDSL